MKEDILKRAMFAMPLSKASRGSGIMAGFEEDINAMDEEDEMPSMARTPQNPEILMNNLRGDMRSVDARYEELAQMVGDEAAMATPPEVMAMLMGQMGQQAGIGALPQGAAMTPPPMPGAPPADPMAAAAPAAPPPAAAPAPAAPAPAAAPPAMPSGMGGAPPFPQGGVSQTPPAPVGMAVGGFLSKGAQALKGAIGRGAQGVEDLIGRGATRADEVLGNYTMSPQPTISPMMGLDGRPVYLHPRESFRQGPGGVIPPGEGSRLSDFATAGQSLQDFRSPTFTGGLKQGVGEARSALEAFSPRAGRVVDVAEKVARPVGAIATIAGLSQTDAAKRMFTTPSGSSSKDLAALVSQIPTGSGPGPAGRPAQKEETIIGSPYSPGTPNSLSRESRTNEVLAGGDDSFFDRASGDSAAGPAASSGTSALADSIKKAVGKRSYSDRVKEGYAELQPLFAEFLGEDKEAAKGNALLLIADAAFKLTKPSLTFATGLAEAVSDLPRGFASISAQDRDRALKVKSAALSGAMERVGAEDKYEQAMKIAEARALTDQLKQNKRYAHEIDLETIKGANAVNIKSLEEALKAGQIQTADAGVGLFEIKDGRGNFIKYALDDNAIKPGGPLHAIATSPNSLNRDSPFVDNYGPAPGTLVQDKAQRLKIQQNIASDDRNLALLAQAKDVVSKVYGPKAFTYDLVNNILVPIGLASPIVDVSDATLTLRNIFNQMGRESAGENGRVSNQGQQWARDTLKQLDNPTGFWQDSSLALNAINNRDAAIRNERYASGSQLGVGTDNLVMKTVPLGIQNDPFVIPADPKKEAVMVNWLKANMGSREDQSRVWVKFPDGRSVSLSPQQIRNLEIK